MFNKRIHRDPIASGARRSAAQRRLGMDAHCSCGEIRPEALDRSGRAVICGSCRRDKEGRVTYDKHHISGKANSEVTILVPVNDHRAAISVDQYNWPKPTLENRDSSPLLSGAACIRGFIDIVKYLSEVEAVNCFIEQFLLWIAVMLEEIDDFLIDLRGRHWWIETRLQVFAPEVSNDKK